MVFGSGFDLASNVPFSSACTKHPGSRPTSRHTHAQIRRTNSHRCHKFRPGARQTPEHTFTLFHSEFHPASAQHALMLGSANGQRLGPYRVGPIPLEAIPL